MNRTLLTLTGLAVAAALCAAPASADVKTDHFDVSIGGDNELFGGGGTGWSDAGEQGEWIYYDQTDWWNQWFYDDPPDPERWKEGVYAFTMTLQMPPPGAIELRGEFSMAVNWSTLDFPETGPDGPPPMPDQEQYIERAVWGVGSVPLSSLPSTPTTGFQQFQIPDFNPEWVSVDVRVIDGWWRVQTGETFVDRPAIVEITLGLIEHECVPEPASMSLLALGGLALIRRRKV